MSLTLVNPKEFVWNLWVNKLDRMEAKILSPLELAWHDAFVDGQFTLEEARALLTQKVQEHYAGR